MLNLSDINLRLSENVEIEKSLKKNKLKELLVDKDVAASLPQIELTEAEKKCGAHSQDFILFCLKC